jgi:hypothetical protein
MNGFRWRAREVALVPTSVALTEAGLLGAVEYLDLRGFRPNAKGTDDEVPRDSALDRAPPRRQGSIGSRHSPFEHTSPVSKRHSSQRLPPEPQAHTLVPGRQVPMLEQQPLGQLPWLHWQDGVPAPPVEQNWPLPHWASRPQRHWPDAQRLASPATQVWQAAPPVPQVARPPS